MVDQPLFALSHGQTVVWHHDRQHSRLKTHSLTLAKIFLKSYFIKKQFFYKKVKNNSSIFFSPIKTCLRDKRIIREFERERMTVKNLSPTPSYCHGGSTTQFTGRSQPSRTGYSSLLLHSPKPKVPLSVPHASSTIGGQSWYTKIWIDACSSCSMDKEIRVVNQLISWHYFNFSLEIWMINDSLDLHPKTQTTVRVEVWLPKDARQRRNGSACPPKLLQVEKQNTVQHLFLSLLEVSADHMCSNFLDSKTATWHQHTAPN